MLSRAKIVIILQGYKTINPFILSFAYSPPPTIFYIILYTTDDSSGKSLAGKIRCRSVPDQTFGLWSTRCRLLLGVDRPFVGTHTKSRNIARRSSQHSNVRRHRINNSACCAHE